MREGFFSARTFTSLDDLNAQARSFCDQIAKERRVPDAKDKTLAEAYLEERSSSSNCPTDHFPVEGVAVPRRQRPYVRFDRNDYGVPYTHVQRALVIVDRRSRAHPRPEHPQ
ncbi:MAG: hypothetical protein U0359_29160 [Byssovorax sp.]